MNLLNSISKKVLLGYIAILALIVVATFILSSKLYMVDKSNDVFIQASLPSLQAVNTATNSANKLMMAAFGLYGYTIDADAFRDIVDTNQDKLNRSLANMSSLQAFSAEFKPKLFFSRLNDLAVIMSAANVDWDAARENLASLQQMMDSFTQAMNRVQQTVKSDAEASVAEVSREIDNMTLWLWLIIATVLVVTAGAIWFAKSNIVSPILSLANQIDEIADSKDLTKTVEVNSKDEINVAAASFNQLLDAYRQTSKNINDATKLVFDSINLLDHSSNHAEAQISLLSNTSDALDEGVGKLELGISDSAHRSRSASQKALVGAEQVARGSANLSQTARIIAELSNDIQVSAEMLLELKNAGDKVSSVVKTIAEIAEQTNLLALNAAIEAARAGESGRGFAVVADEVRTLATRTHTSTYEINSILDQIVSSISSTVQSMAHNQNKASDAVEAAQTTVTSLHELETTVMTLSDENAQLAQLAQENHTDATNMRASIIEVNGAVTHVNESTEETRQAAANLNELSHSLKEIVSQYRT